MIAIEARDITKSFGTAQVLKGASLAAQQGDVISIIGTSGSGKSTFLRCLNLLEVPDRGEIRVGEEHLEIGAGRNGLDRGRSNASGAVSQWCSRASISGTT